MKNGINIELTPSQYDYLYEVIMMAYELDVPEQKGWDMQTYDNMVDNVCNGTSTILSNNVKGVLWTFTKKSLNATKAKLMSMLRLRLSSESETNFIISYSETIFNPIGHFW